MELKIGNVVHFRRIMNAVLTDSGGDQVSEQRPDAESAHGVPEGSSHHAHHRLGTHCQIVWRRTRHYRPDAGKGGYAIVFIGVNWARNVL